MLSTRAAFFEGVSCTNSANNTENEAKDYNDLDDLQHESPQESSVVCFVDAIKESVESSENHKFERREGNVVENRVSFVNTSMWRAVED